MKGIAQRVDEKAQDLDMLDWMGRAALEIIGKAGLGHSFGALEGKNDEYYVALKNMLCVYFFVHVSGLTASR